MAPCLLASVLKFACSSVTSACTSSLSIRCCSLISSMAKSDRPKCAVLARRAERVRFSRSCTFCICSLCSARAWRVKGVEPLEQMGAMRPRKAGVGIHTDSRSCVFPARRDSI